MGTTPASRAMLALLVLLAWPQARAGLTDVSQTPLLTATAPAVKPNLMVIMDDSGSMDSVFTPEDARSVAHGSRYGLFARQCNGMAYDPATSYTPPISGNGTHMLPGNIDALMSASASDAGGWRWLRASNTHGLNTSKPVRGVRQGGTVDIKSTTWDSSHFVNNAAVTLYSESNPQTWVIGTLGSVNQGTRTATVQILATSGTRSNASQSMAVSLSNPRLQPGWPPFVYYNYSGTQGKLSYPRDSVGAVDLGSTFFTQCNTVIGKSNAFNPVVVLRDSAEAQNMANWWAYYSTRMAMMKAVVTNAFNHLDARYRIGYTTILNKSATENSTPLRFAHIRDFDTAQRLRFFSAIQRTSPSGTTPLRGALSLAGRYYANRANGQGGIDPMQFSCQKNFALLATDGQWNQWDETSAFGPLGLNGQQVGQQDGGNTRPYRDGGIANTLADVAMYYYSTDLRDASLGNCTGNAGDDVCQNNVPPSPARADQTATTQHMITYTLGLGLRGNLAYDPGYHRQPAGDYAAILAGTREWANPVMTSDTDPGKVDDLWHAAVNGRGIYFNGSDPRSIRDGLAAMLADVRRLNATAAGSTASNTWPADGNTRVFLPSYTSVQWTGDLRAYAQGADGSMTLKDNQGHDAALWSAAALLRANTQRRVYYAQGTTLRPFTFANLSADGSASHFQGLCAAGTGAGARAPLSQCGALTATDLAAANTGTTFVDYLTGTEHAAYRPRAQKLGDIVGSAPVFIGAATITDNDAAASAYRNTASTRTPAIYVGANDGMLHAFNAGNGQELWAFVPRAVFPNLHKLADSNYETQHQFFVDGTPTVADVKINGNWKTVLVSGLGAGGKAYFALDVTDPSNPLPLWEFTDTDDLGLTHGTPLIVQQAGGDWVAVFSSGYNNSGQGKGHLFMVNLATGALVRKFTTTAGSAATPSGLGPVTAWVESTSNTIASHFYAGDTLGNVWRFDPAQTGAAAVVQLARLVVNGVAQPITTAPVPAQILHNGAPQAVVFVGTGRMVGQADMSDQAVQSIYAFLDPVAANAPGYGDLRASGLLLRQTLTTTNGNARTALANPVPWGSKVGWYLDLPSSGERINLEMMLRFNTLVAGSNVPQSSATATCQAGGSGQSWLYFLDIGFANAARATLIDSAMTASLYSFKMRDGSLRAGAELTNSARTDPQALRPPGALLPAARKTSWRELVEAR